MTTDWEDELEQIRVRLDAGEITWEQASDEADKVDIPWRMSGDPTLHNVRARDVLTEVAEWRLRKNAEALHPIEQHEVRLKEGARSMGVVRCGRCKRTVGQILATSAGPLMVDLPLGMGPCLLDWDDEGNEGPPRAGLCVHCNMRVLLPTRADLWSAIKRKKPAIAPVIEGVSPSFAVVSAWGDMEKPPGWRQAPWLRPTITEDTTEG